MKKAPEALRLATGTLWSCSICGCCRWFPWCRRRDRRERGIPPSPPAGGVFGHPGGMAVGVAFLHVDDPGEGCRDLADKERVFPLLELQRAGLLPEQVEAHQQRKYQYAQSGKVGGAVALQAVIPYDIQHHADGQRAKAGEQAVGQLPLRRMNYIYHIPLRP